MKALLRIDPHRLLRLSELIKEGSFRRAAESLNITQPALSQSIMQMEGEVGVRLIDRTPHGVVPTIYGEALLRHAKEIEWQLSEAAKKIAELAYGHHKLLAIGGTSGGPISILTLTICRLREIIPDINTRIFEEIWSRALMAQVDDRSLDIAICQQPDDLEMEGKIAQPLFQGRRVLCVRAGHPEAKNLTLRTMAKYPFACPGGEIGVFDDIKRIFDALQIDFPTHQVIILNSLSAAKEIVLNSDAFAILSDLSVLHENKAGLLKLAELDEISTAYWYCLVAREEHMFSELVGDFVSVLATVCQELGIELHPDIGRIKAGQRLRR